jgi:glycosyltransferase involved in cell wall biosynthesis
VVFGGEGIAADLITRSGAGLAVPPSDAPALAAAISRLAADPTTRQQLGSAGRATILDRFDRATVAGQIAASLRRAAGR